MVTLSIALLLIGVVLLIIELHVPGITVFGVSGGFAIVASIIITILYVPYGIFIVAGETVMLAVLVMSVVRYIKTHQLYGKIILDETLAFDKEEYGNLEGFMNKDGVVKTPLRPFGAVDFDGIIMEAWSDGPYIPEYMRVRVTNVVNDRIIVKRIEQ